MQDYSENPRRPVILVHLHALHCRDEAMLREHFSSFGDITLVDYLRWVQYLRQRSYVCETQSKH